jgi:hypothetical protein
MKKEIDRKVRLDTKSENLKKELRATANQITTEPFMNRRRQRRLPNSRQGNRDLMVFSALAE